MFFGRCRTRPPGLPARQPRASALAHAGADLCDFTDVEDSYRVTFTVDGHRHVSVVSKADLTVQSAGICLSGEDEKFDLNSLVGVLREGGV